MSLYISSYRVPNPEKLFGLLSTEPEDTKMTIITNAKDQKTAAERSRSLTDLAGDLGKLGLRGAMIDLRHYADEAERLRRDLAGVNLLFVCGGNTFALRHAMHTSGFDQMAGSLIDEGMTYAGESAGAIVIGTTLRGFETPDDPPDLPQEVNEGIGLIDAVIVPHADNPDYVGRVDRLRGQHPDQPMIILGDRDDLSVP